MMHTSQTLIGSEKSWAIFILVDQSVSWHTTRHQFSRRLDLNTSKIPGRPLLRRISYLPRAIRCEVQSGIGPTDIHTTPQSSRSVGSESSVINGDMLYLVLSLPRASMSGLMWVRLSRYRKGEVRRSAELCYYILDIIWEEQRAGHSSSRTTTINYCVCLSATLYLGILEPEIDWRV